MLASFWHHFYITFSSFISASFFSHFFNFLEPAKRTNGCFSNEKAMIFKKVTNSEKIKTSSILASILASFLHLFGIIFRHFFDIVFWMLFWMPFLRCWDQKWSKNGPTLRGRTPPLALQRPIPKRIRAAASIPDRFLVDIWPSWLRFLLFLHCFGAPKPPQSDQKTHPRRNFDFTLVSY